MLPQIRSAEFRGRFVVHIGFEDGASGDVNFQDELWGEVFEPLRDQAQFRQLRLDRELNTIVWPTGADFAPESFTWVAAHTLKV